VSEERIRLFVALELPDTVREKLRDWRDYALQGADGVRPIPAEAMHATLCFLGWRSADQIDAIRDACGVLVAQPVPELALGHATWLPPRRPRVLAVEIQDGAGALARVQATLAGVLEAGGWYQPEKRPYLAHITVARVGRGAKVSCEIPAVPLLTFSAPRITLYRSRLFRAGARYEPLGTVELAA